MSKNGDLFLMINLQSIVVEHIQHKMVGGSKRLQILYATFS
jgi:hypothetical protein